MIDGTFSEEYSKSNKKDKRGGSKVKNRLLSLILTVAMLVSMMPVTVMAAEEGPKVLIDHVKYVDNGELCQDVDVMARKVRENCRRV